MAGHHAGNDTQRAHDVRLCFVTNRRERTMIKVSILYPYREGGRFDVDYYCGTHMPLAAKLLGEPLKGWSVDIGINAGPPGSPPPFVAAGHFLFDTVEARFTRSSNPPATHCSPTFRTTRTAATAKS